MHSALDFLLHHGYVVLLVWVFAEQLGLPVPSLPILLAAGALAGTGRFNFAGSIFLSVFAALLADSMWYGLGRIRGIKVLQLLCKISLEPDSCVRRTEGLFAKQGARSLVFAKFVPGLGSVAPPLAGIFHMRPERFLLFDVLGALLWSSVYIGLGYAFSGQIERIAEHAFHLGGGLGVLIIGALVGYISYKWIFGIPWTSRLTHTRFPALSAWTLKIWKRTKTACLATARLFSTVLDQTKLPAPVWRCF